MESNNRIGAVQMLDIKCHGLFCQQVHRNGIAAESVKYHHIEFLKLPPLCLVLQGNPRVPHHNVNCGPRILQEAEPWFLPQRELHYLRVNFVKPEVIAGMSVSRQRACSETYYPHSQAPSLPAPIEQYRVMIQNQPNAA